MWVVPTATWACPATVMGLWVEASSFTACASSCEKKNHGGFARALCPLPAQRRTFITSLFSAMKLKGVFSCSSRSLSSWVRRWGLRGEPARAWQKMELTGEVLNLQHAPHVSFGGQTEHSLIGKWSRSGGSTCILGASRAAVSTPPPHIHRSWPRPQTGSHAWPPGGRRTARLSCEPGSASACTGSRFPAPLRSKESADLLYSLWGPELPAKTRKKLWRTRQIGPQFYYDTYFCLHCWFGLFLHFFWKNVSSLLNNDKNTNVCKDAN